MATQFLRRTLLTSTALIGLGSVAIAQSTTEDETDDEAVSESTYLSPLTIGSGWVGAGDPFTKTAAVSSISKDEIGLFGGQNIDNAIRSQPGVSTRDNQQNTGVAVNIRGLEGSGRVAMSIDGARQNFRFTGHEAQGFTYVDPALLAGVDIQRGSAEGASGAGALAGSADFRTIGVDDVLETGDDFGGYVTSSIGDNGSGTAPSGAVAFRVNDTFALLAASSYRNTDDYKNANGQTVANTYQETQSNLVKAEITPSADQKITISGMIYSSDFLSNGYPQNVTNKTGTIQYDYTPEDNDLVDLHANLYINDTTMKYGKNQTSTGGAAQGRVIDDTGAGLDITNTSRGAIGDNLIASTYGFSISGDNVYVLNNSTSTATGVNPSGVSTLSSIYNSTTLTVGAIDLTGGLRYDYYTASGEAYDKLAAATVDVDRAEGRLLPSAKIALNNLDWFQPYLSYDETFRPPTTNELLLGGSHPGSGGFYYANPDLESEYARTVELGTNIVRDGVFTGDDRLQVKADVFYSLVDNYITALYDSSLGGYVFGNNEGTSTIAGFELQAGYDAGFAFASLAYTHTETDLPSQVNGLGAQSYLPEDTFTATAGVRVLDNQALTLGGRLYAVSDSYIGTVNAGSGSAYTPGYTLVDLFANYKFDNGVELGASISNVFDVAYTPALSTTPSTSGQVTGRGRTIELTAKARF